jgi:hypothetical protein
MRPPSHWSVLPLLAIDLETTGLDAERDELIEWGAARLRGGRVTETVGSLVRPEGPISPDAQRITGLDAEQLQSAPPLRDVLDTIADELEQAEALIAYNASFDRTFLARGPAVSCPTARGSIPFPCCFSSSAAPAARSSSARSAPGGTSSSSARTARATTPLPLPSSCSAWATTRTPAPSRSWSPPSSARSETAASGKGPLSRLRGEEAGFRAVVFDSGCLPT